MRVCLVYDCLYPWTVGGGERWLRSLAERLAAEGHDVTYVTLRQWERDAPPAIPGVRVVAVGPRMALYAGGRRRILPPLVFGAGVLAHLVRHGRRYDVVHTAAFPYFSLLAAAVARPLGRFGLVTDWYEVWTRGYWRDYLGGAGGRVGELVQWLCARVRQRAFVFSALHAQRLRELGLRGDVVTLAGLYGGPTARPEVRDAAEPPTVVFAGRHIPEKEPAAIVPAVAAARRRLPGLRARILGDGPVRGEVLEAVRAHGLEDAVDVPGFVDAAEVDAALRSCLCMVLPSRREGYGLIVVEAAAHGAPSIVVAHPDNAAVELVEEGVNGVVAESVGALAEAILDVHERGRALRESTAAWFGDHADRLTVAASLDAVAEAYRR